MMTATEARHFYDLYHLWDEDQSPALSWLSEGDNFVELLSKLMEVSRRWFPDNPADIPSSGFANWLVGTRRPSGASRVMSWWSLVAGTWCTGWDRS
ncbi:MAG: hypothetical protein ACYCV7_04330 [Acidimicrobiales bacterium]